MPLYSELDSMTTESDVEQKFLYPFLHTEPPMGLGYIVPVGEMECFDRTVNEEKKDWVYHVLENYNLAIEPKLEAARQFVKDIDEFKATTT